MKTETKILITVNGGLEDIAKNQVKLHFKGVLIYLRWNRRSSGSQLYLTLNKDADLGCSVSGLIADSICTLDFVEYIYILLDSSTIPPTSDGTHTDNEEDSRADILRRVHEVSASIPVDDFKFCQQICNIILDDGKWIDVGLGGLPGKVLPTPQLPVSNHDHCVNTQCHDFAVNTIYTVKNVSRVVVLRIIEFIQQYHPNYKLVETLWVDAGAGDGSLLENLPERSMGIDTHPTSPRVHSMDFLDVSRDWLLQQIEYKELVVISNPPFSESSRGDYTPIVRFMNHSFDILKAKFVAVLCPSKFARERVWRSLGLTDIAHLWGRFTLPQNSFYEPSTGKSVHIHSCCLIFGDHDMEKDSNSATVPRCGVHIVAKRDKGSHPGISTAELTACIVSGLAKAGMNLATERHAKYILHAKLLESSFELWWQINPLQPCSLVNSNSAKISNHSLGWISLSVKPAIALAMTSLVMADQCNIGKSLIVNSMSGEGTIELEAGKAFDHPFFMISGDKRFDCALDTLQRVDSLKTWSSSRVLVDIVLWDAQNLPLRKGMADGVLADLPFQGSIKKTHQQPTTGASGSTSPTLTLLKYSSVLSEASRVLKPKGRAVFVSADCNALSGACKQFNWTLLDYGTTTNLGGLTGKMFVVERNEACTKDVCLWVPPNSTDLSAWIFNLVHDNSFEEATEAILGRKFTQPVIRIAMRDTFFHPQRQYLRHCYRITFDDQIRNVLAKLLEKEIRRVIEENLMEGMSL